MQQAQEVGTQPQGRGPFDQPPQQGSPALIDQGGASQPFPDFWAQFQQEHPQAPPLLREAAKNVYEYSRALFAAPGVGGGEQFQQHDYTYGQYLQNVAVAAAAAKTGTKPPGKGTPRAASSGTSEMK